MWLSHTDRPKLYINSWAGQADALCNGIIDG
jgi:hypothetical protein